MINRMRTAASWNVIGPRSLNFWRITLITSLSLPPSDLLEISHQECHVFIIGLNYWIYYISIYLLQKFDMVVVPLLPWSNEDDLKPNPSEEQVE
jgi:hypothetical protein